jgi:hypothetical protein
MPAVVPGGILVAHGLGLVDVEDDLWHERHLPCWVRRRDAEACLVRSPWDCRRWRGTGTSTTLTQSRTRISREVGERLAGWKDRHALWTLLRSSSSGRSGWCWFYWALTGKHSRPAPGEGYWLRRLGRRLGFGKASEGRIGCAGTSWSTVRGQAVDHLRVVAAGLLTGQHRGKGLGSPIGHRHGEDPLGVPTTRRARRRRRGCAHRHLLLETAAVIAAILVDGHATLQGRQRSEALGPEACSMPTYPHRQERTDRQVLSHRDLVASHTLLPSRLGEDR